MQKILKWVGIAVALLGAVVGILLATTVEVWHVPEDDIDMAASLVPNLAAGDTVLVAKDSVPTLPDLVRCDDPDKPGEYVVARIVGLTGDSVNIASDVVTNGKRRRPSPRRCDTPVVTARDKSGNDHELECWQEEFGDRSFMVTRSGPKSTPETPKVIAVPAGQIFLVSDNRPIHLDSRDYGPLEAFKCRRVYMVLWGSGGVLDFKFRWVS